MLLPNSPASAALPFLGGQLVQGKALEEIRHLLVTPALPFPHLILSSSLVFSLGFSSLISSLEFRGPTCMPSPGPNLSSVYLEAGSLSSSSFLCAGDVAVTVHWAGGRHFCTESLNVTFMVSPLSPHPALHDSLHRLLPLLQAQLPAATASLDSHGRTWRPVGVIFLETCLPEPPSRLQTELAVLCSRDPACRPGDFLLFLWPFGLVSLSHWYFPDKGTWDVIFLGFAC